MAERKITIRRVMAGEREISYQLERKAVKNLNLRVREDGSVYASAPRQVSAAEIDAFVASRGAFILQAVARMEERPLVLRRGDKLALFQEGEGFILQVKEPEDPVQRQKGLERGLDYICQEIFQGMLEELYPLAAKQGAAKPLLRIRRMKSRWGSCLPGKGIITLNKRLLEAPRGCIQYVILHELCHLIHPDHSKRFYGLLAAWMPDWKEWKTRLEETVLL